MKRVLLLCTIGLVGLLQTTAQDDVMPDLVGLSVPEAISTLNALGLSLGQVEQDTWFDNAANPVDTVSSQAPLPGDPLPTTARVDVTIWRQPNITLLYNDEQFNLRSDDMTVEFLHFANLRFEAVDDPTVRLSQADEAWNFGGVRELAEQFCVQLHTENVNNFDGSVDCEAIRRWINALDEAHHFWIGSGRFRIYQDDLLLGTCPQTDTARMEMCEFAIASSETAIATFTTAYAFFRYDSEQLYIHNRASDQIMPFNQFDLQVDVAFGDIVYDFGTVPNLSYLAPGQCIWIHLAGVAPILDNDCEVVANAEIPARQLFWEEGFTLRPQQARQNPQTCPPPVGATPIICMIPR